MNQLLKIILKFKNYILIVKIGYYQFILEDSPQTYNSKVDHRTKKAF